MLYKYLTNYLKLTMHYNNIFKLLNYQMNKTRVYELYQAISTKNAPKLQKRDLGLPKNSNSQELFQTHFRLHLEQL